METALYPLKINPILPNLKHECESTINPKVKGNPEANPSNGKYSKGGWPPFDRPEKNPKSRNKEIHQDPSFNQMSELEKSPGLPL
jgi:hypothetical protein